VLVEFETLVGLERFATAEISTRLPAQKLARSTSGRLTARAPAHTPIEDLNALRSVVAAYVVEEFDVPRPRALLGQAHFERIVEAAYTVLAAYPSVAFRTLRVSAAGADSSVFERFKLELGDAVALDVVPTGGDLLVAVRRGGPGWQVLVRTSPRPLATRVWRVCDFPGALNATAAHAMCVLADPGPSDVYVNIACGSGTLLIERLALGTARQALGYDVDETALACALANVAAAGFSASITLERRDATALALDDGSVDALAADLPYAMLLGGGAANAELYPALIDEAARVLKPAGRLLVVTTQNRLMASVCEGRAGVLRLVERVPFEVPRERGAISPSIWALERL
jgi:23S rRNA G2445 N2-methylase RlmL